MVKFCGILQNLLGLLVTNQFENLAVLFSMKSEIRLSSKN